MYQANPTFIARLLFLLMIMTPLLRPSAAGATDASVDTKVSATANTGGNQAGNGTIKTGDNSAMVRVEQQINGQTLPIVDLKASGSSDQSVSVNRTVTQTNQSAPTVVTNTTIQPPAATSPSAVKPQPAVGSNSSAVTNTPAAVTPVADQPGFWARLFQRLASVWTRLLKVFA